MLNVEELRETLEINRNDLRNNRMLTNELIIDDIMVGLGYNKKRDKSVKRLYDHLLDWEVINEGEVTIKIAVKVYAIDERLSQSELDSVLDECKEKRFSILLITNGETIEVNRYQKEKLNYTKVCELSITRELTEKESKVLDAISKDTYNLKIIDDILNNQKIEPQEILNIMLSNISDFANLAAELLGDTSANAKDQCISYIDAILKNRTLEAPKEDNSAESENATGNSGITSEEVASYREQIQTLTKELADAKDTIAQLNEDMKLATEEINNMSGADRKRAQELLAVIEDNPELDRHYVGVINTELIQFDNINTFVGRALQKLYDIKNFAVSQYIFNGDIFTLVQPATRNDLIMNNKAYDLDFKGEHEDEILNKIRIVFSHFDDVIFECKKIGTKNKSSQASSVSLEKSPEETITPLDTTMGVEDGIEYVEDSEEEELIDFGNNTEEASGEFETLEELDNMDESEQLSPEEADNIFDDASDLFGDSQGSEGFEAFENVEGEEQDAFTPSEELEGLDGTDEIFDNPEDNQGFGEDTGEQMFTDNFDTGMDTQDNWNENPSAETIDIIPSENVEFAEEGTGFIDDGSGIELQLEGQDIDENGEQFAETIGDFESALDETDSGEVGTYLLVGQLLQIDQLIWGDEKVKFNNIKYIGTNSITYNINSAGDNLTNEQLLSKCVDAVLSIEAYSGNTDIVKQLKLLDFSKVNNFLRLYTEEYVGFPKINGTRYAIVDVDSVQQVASILLDVCNAMHINTEEIFVYFEAETASQYIITNYDFPEDAVQLREYNEFTKPEDPNNAVAIIRGDLFSNIVVTKNSLQAHKDILVNSLAIKTKYLAKVLEKQSDVVEVIEQMLLEATGDNLTIDYTAIGNVIGESYKIVSSSEFDVSPEHSSITSLGGVVYVSYIEPWQIMHTLIKVHTTIFNNTSIAIKELVNVDAINFYGKEFETSEPSLALAVKSFVDYIALNVKK